MIKLIDKKIKEQHGIKIKNVVIKEYYHGF